MDTPLRSASVPVDEAALLSGLVSIPNETLSSAFREGLRAARGELEADETVRPPALDARHFPRLLASTNATLRSGALHTLTSLLASQSPAAFAQLHGMVAEGLLMPTLCERTAQLARLVHVLPSSSGDDAGQVQPPGIAALVEAGQLATLLHSLCVLIRSGRLPAYATGPVCVGTPAAEEQEEASAAVRCRLEAVHIRQLADAVAHVLDACKEIRDMRACEQSGDARLLCLHPMLNALFLLCAVVGSSDPVKDAAATTLSAEGVMQGALNVMKLKSDVGSLCARLLNWCADTAEWALAFTALPQGWATVLDIISSTVYDAKYVMRLLGAVANGCSGEAGEAVAACLVSHGACELLQPAMLSSTAGVAIHACKVLAHIAALPNTVISESQASEALAVVEDVLRSAPLHHVDPGCGGSEADIPGYIRLCRQDMAPVFQLVATHDMLNMDLTEWSNRAYLLKPAVLACVRSCASSADAFVYTAAAHLLRSIDQPVPMYRAKGNAAGGKGNPSTWTIEDVWAWVGSQPFRQYRTHFRDALVCGRLLLSLDDAELQAIGVAHRVHRRAMGIALEDLKAAHGMSSVSAGSVSLLSPPRHLISPTSSTGREGTPHEGEQGTPLAGMLSPLSRAGSAQSSASSYRYDVFISYRRAGGADFAQLLKLQLRALGLEVFLDVENLGTGDFSDQLVESIHTSRAVLLVWTKGCMDRFLGDSDPSCTDFVRMEYAQALRLKKTVVPVYKEDFVFPGEAQLPADVRGVMRLNAVRWSPEYREACVAKLKAALQV